MISLEDLRVTTFQGVSNKHLELIRPLVVLESYEKGASICKKGDVAEVFFILKSGRATEEHELTPSVTAALNTIVGGQCFGLSALLPEESNFYKSTVVAAEECEVLHIAAHEFVDKMDSNPEAGYFILRSVLDSLVNRSTSRTDQFLKLLSMHPDLSPLLAEE